LAAGGVLAAVILFFFFGYRQTIEVSVDGQRMSVVSGAHRVGDVLSEAGIALRAGDQLDPPAESWFFAPPAIRLSRAIPVQIWDGDHAQDLVSQERQVAHLLSQAGLSLEPGDRLWVDGSPATPTTTLSPERAHLIQIERGVTIHLDEGNGVRKEITSTAATLGEALWQAGIRAGPADRLSPPAETPLTGNVEARLIHAVKLSIQTQSGDVAAFSAARTVGEALSEAGLGLQGLDYSVPGEDQPVPGDGKIRVVRVIEEIQLTQKLLPYRKEYKMDAETELDHERVIQAGQPGIVMTRERARYEDGKEVSRAKEAEWTAQQPVNAVVGRGTKVVVHTEKVNGETIEYWRKVTVYATSYSPCQSGTDKCMNGTASGMPLRQGVVAVSWNWYRDMVGQRIYVPGYGKAVIGDNGGGIPGRYWIDLGYTDDQYQPWHQWVTIYFLTPAPKIIPYILYP